MTMTFNIHKKTLVYILITVYRLFGQDLLLYETLQTFLQS